MTYDLDLKRDQGQMLLWPRIMEWGERGDRWARGERGKRREMSERRVRKRGERGEREERYVSSSKFILKNKQQTTCTNSGVTELWPHCLPIIYNLSTSKDPQTKIMLHCSLTIITTKIKSTLMTNMPKTVWILYQYNLWIGTWSFCTNSQYIWEDI